MGMFDAIIEAKNQKVEKEIIDTSTLYQIANMCRDFVVKNKQDLLNLFTTITISERGAANSTIVSVERNIKKMQTGSVVNGVMASYTEVLRKDYVSLDIVKNIEGKGKWAFLIHSRNGTIDKVHFDPDAEEYNIILKLRIALDKLVFVAYDPEI